jgi:hypothetical protein
MGGRRNALATSRRITKMSPWKEDWDPEEDLELEEILEILTEEALMEMTDEEYDEYVEFNKC